MQPPRNKDSYFVPASPEVVAHEQEQLRRAALEAAISTPETLDPTVIDYGRIEGMGASVVSAAEVKSQPATSEAAFDPLDFAQILTCGKGAVSIRGYAMENLTREDLDLGA